MNWYWRGGVVRRLAAATLVVLVLPTWAENEPRDAWVEEILLQLSEVRKSEGDLRQQVADLQAKVQALQSAGRPPSVSLDLRNDSYPVLGNGKSSVAMVEFSDFQCPFCRRYQQTTMPALTEKYISSGKIRYVFVNFPLGFHEHAEPAAVAGVCAQRQGAFWKMRDRLFDNQDTLGSETFLKIASDLKLNGDQFNQCLQDPKVSADIRAQAQLGESVGVQGTPAFLIGRVRDGVLTNPILVSGAQPLASFERVIDPLLAGAAAGP
jgi:protein-disulfide isomerase